MSPPLLMSRFKINSDYVGTSRRGSAARTMVNTIKNDSRQLSNQPALVLDQTIPEAVGRAMIEGGHQKLPFFIFNMDEAFRRIQHLRDLMPRVKLFYAMKSNNTEMFLKLAISQGTGFSCASPGELKQLRNLNINPRSIIYAMSTKTPEQMAHARESGVMHTTFDSSNELKKLSEHWPDAQLLIRIRVKNDVPIKLRDKFGCDFEKDSINLLQEAADLGLKVVGVAFHVGATWNDFKSYIDGLNYAKALFDHETKAGREMKILDIGGGFRSANGCSIEKLYLHINATLEELFADPTIQVIAEPGRYLCDSAFTLYCSVTNVRTVHRDGQLLNMVYISDGIYGSLRNSANGFTVKKFKYTGPQQIEELQETILWGPSGDSLDRILKDVSLYLPKCTTFDWLIFQNIGANSVAFATKFSCLETPLIRPVVSTDLWNAIKHKDVFDSSNDFIVNPDILSPLSVTLPPVLPEKRSYEHSHAPSLKV